MDLAAQDSEIFLVFPNSDEKISITSYKLRIPKEPMRPNVHSSTIYYSQVMEAT